MSMHLFVKDLSFTFDVPKKSHNKEYEKIGLVPFEISIRDKIGEVVSVQNIETVPERIEFLYESYQ